MPDRYERFIDLDRMLNKVSFVTMQAMLNGETRFFPKCGWQIKFAAGDNAEFFKDAALPEFNLQPKPTPAVPEADSGKVP